MRRTVQRKEQREENSCLCLYFSLSGEVSLFIQVLLSGYIRVLLALIPILAPHFPATLSAALEFSLTTSVELGAHLSLPQPYPHPRVLYHSRVATFFPTKRSALVDEIIQLIIKADKRNEPSHNTGLTLVLAIPMLFSIGLQV